jgi:hypothetical protein
VTDLREWRIINAMVYAQPRFRRLAHKSNAQDLDYLFERKGPSSLHQSRTFRPTNWRTPMKNMILAAVAALSLTAAIVPAANAASSVAGDAQATRTQQTGAYGNN